MRSLQASAPLALMRMRDALRRGARAALDALRAPVQPVHDAAAAAAGATHAVAETAQRAADASKDVAREVRLELEAWSRGLARTLAYAGALGLAALFALVLLTLAAVEGLDHALGEPWGAVIVGLAYVVASVAVFLAMRHAKEAAKADRERHAGHLKEDVAHVVEPMVEALGAAPPGTARKPGA